MNIFQPTDVVIRLVNIIGKQAFGLFTYNIPVAAGNINTIDNTLALARQY